MLEYWPNVSIQPDQSLQAALFDIICENFVVLLTGIDNEQKDPVFRVSSFSVFEALCML